MGADLRLDAVELLYDKTKKSLGANFRFLSEAEVGQPASYIHNIPYNDARIWKNNTLVASIFTSEMTAFTNPTKKDGENVVMDYRDTPPYVFFRKTPKEEDFDEYTGLYDVMSDTVRNNDKDKALASFARYDMYPSVISAASEKERARLKAPTRQRIKGAGATAEQQIKLKVFLYGFPVASYLDGNIKQTGDTYVFNPTLRPTWDKGVLDLVAVIVAKNKGTTMERLTDYVRNPSKTESRLVPFGSQKDVGEFYDDEPVGDDDAGKNTTTATTTTTTRQPDSDDDDNRSSDDSDNDSNDSGVTDSSSDDEPPTKPVINEPPKKPAQNTAPVNPPSTNKPKIAVTFAEPGHIQLRRLHKILGNVSQDQMAGDTFWALSKFINAFNASFCSEVSPYKDNVIEPIYVTIGRTPYRLHGVRIANNTFIYAFVDVNDSFTTYEQDDDDLVRAIESDVTTAFPDHPVVESTDSYIVQYANRRPWYREIRRYYTKLSLRGTWDRCWDANGLDLLIGYGNTDGEDGRWHVDSRYVKIKPVGASIVGDRPTRGNTALTKTQQQTLRKFLFEPDFYKTEIKDVLQESIQWTAKYKIENLSSWFDILDNIKEENMAIYNHLAPNGHRFPVPTRDTDINYVLDAIPKARKLIENVEKLDEAVKKLTVENKRLESELKNCRTPFSKQTEIMAQQQAQIEQLQKAVDDARNADNNELENRVDELEKEIESEKKLVRQLEANKNKSEEERGKIIEERENAKREATETRDELKRVTNEKDRLDAIDKLKNAYYLAVYKKMDALYDEVTGDADEDGFIQFNLGEFYDKLTAMTNEINVLQGVLTNDIKDVSIGKNDSGTTTTKAQFMAGVDVITSNAAFSRMIRENVFKGKYSAELSIVSPGEKATTPVLHMKFDNIGTYTDENTKRLVYGARCSKNSRVTWHTKNKNKLPANTGETGMKVCIKDEYGNMIKERTVPLDSAPDDGHAYMLKCDDTRVYLTRSSETGELGVKMLIVDV